MASKIHDKDKSIEYINSRKNTNYDSRWLKGVSQKYVDFSIKKPEDHVYNQKTSMIKHYRVDYEPLEEQIENQE